MNRTVSKYSRVGPAVTRIRIIEVNAECLIANYKYRAQPLFIRNISFAIRYFSGAVEEEIPSSMGTIAARMSCGSAMRPGPTLRHANQPSPGSTM